MGLLSFFKRSSQVPNLTDTQIDKFFNLYIHKNDRYLVEMEDIMWLMSLKMNDIQEMFNQDDAFRGGRFVSLRKSGVNMKDALKDIIKDFPIFYIEINDRSHMPNYKNDPIIFADHDLKLPFCIKNRLNMFLQSTSYDKGKADIFKQHINSSSSANAAIRTMIKMKIF